MIQQFPQFKPNKGFILLPVVFTLTILAAVAYLLSREGAINAGNVNREQQQDTALYIAQAGYNRAIWHLKRQDCTGYTDIATTSFGDHSYKVTFTDATGATLTAGSPVNIKVKGTHASGVSYTINRYQIKFYGPQITMPPLHPDATEGIDTWVTANQPTNNYGQTNILAISGDASLKYFLAKFDVSSIPSGSKIISAKLEMHLNYMDSEDSAGIFSIYAMLEDWAEGTGDWWNPGDGANWNTSDGSTLWSWNNNHATDAVATRSVNAGFSGWHDWEIGTLVQSWVSDAGSNYGLLIKGNENVSGAQFHSSDNGSHHPKLTITYTFEC
jgi:hypothetical protein